MYRLEREDLSSLVGRYLIDLRKTKLTVQTWHNSGIFYNVVRTFSGDNLFDIRSFLKYIKKGGINKDFKINWISPYPGIDKTETIIRACIFSINNPMIIDSPIFIFLNTNGVYGPIGYIKEDGTLSNSFNNPFNRPTFIFESDIEIELFSIKREIERTGESIKLIQGFLDNPWEEYNTKKKKFDEKLEKARTATEFKIKEATKNLDKEKKKLEELNKKLTGIFTGNKNK